MVSDFIFFFFFLKQLEKKIEVELGRKFDLKEKTLGKRVRKVEDQLEKVTQCVTCRGQLVRGSCID